MIRPWIKQAIKAAAPRRVVLFRGASGVALTFDDGPNAEHTPRYLDLLRQNDVRATFFVVGKNAERHPELVRRIVAEGHEIGNHGYRHLRASAVPLADVREDLKLASTRLRSIARARIRLYRPPYGSLPLLPFWHVLKQGLVTVMWDVDSLDYRKQVDLVREQLRERVRWHGHVILLHDDHGCALEALPELIHEGMKKGCAFKTVSELIHGA